MRKQSLILTIGAIVAIAGVGMTATVQAQSKGAEKRSEKATHAQDVKSDVYTLGYCPVSREELGAMGKPVIKTYDGREVRFCCNNCVGKFEDDKEKYFKEIDEAMIEQQLEYYPIETCIVSDEPLGGDMGEPVNYVYGNRLVRFCCNGCKKDFNKDPKTYLEKLDAAVVDRQKDDYPKTTCVVSGEELGSMGDPINYIVANRLVRFCCNGCVKSFEKEPAKYLNEL